MDKELLQKIKASLSTGRTELRLIKFNFDVLPAAINGKVTITTDDEITISRVDDSAISFEITREIKVDPVSLFSIKATCFMKKYLGADANQLPSLKTLDIKQFISENLDLANVAFSHLSYIFSSVTTSFGGTPLVTMPLATNKVNIKVIEQ